MSKSALPKSVTIRPGAIQRKKLLKNDSGVGEFTTAYNYPCESRYEKVLHRTLVVATASDLLQPSRAAAESIRGAQLKEFPGIEAPTLENGSGAISQAALAFLDG